MLPDVGGAALFFILMVLHIELEVYVNVGHFAPVTRDIYQLPLMIVYFSWLCAMGIRAGEDISQTKLLRRGYVVKADGSFDFDGFSDLWGEGWEEGTRRLKECGLSLPLVEGGPFSGVIPIGGDVLRDQDVDRDGHG